MIVAAVFLYARYSRSAEKTSVAVLQFVNYGNNLNTEYLSDGITQNIINNLAKIPKLRVLSRGIVVGYKGQDVDPQKVGRDLNVDVVVTGTVREQGSTLDVSVDLVRVSDGSQVWGQDYNRNFTEIIPVQSEISQTIAEKLNVGLSAEQKKEL